MLQTSHNLKRVENYNQEALLIENLIANFENKVKKMPEGVDKNKGKEILKIVNKILGFKLNERKQSEQEALRLEILTSSQMFSRFPISLAHWRAENNSQKLKN